MGTANFIGEINRQCAHAAKAPQPSVLPTSKLLTTVLFPSSSSDSLRRLHRNGVEDGNALFVGSALQDQKLASVSGELRAMDVIEHAD